jgi:hypothetical protein
MLTYNQILKRIQQLCVHHAQVKSYKYARPTDFLTEKTTEFTAVFLQDNDGNVSISSKQQTINFKLFVLDLVNVSEDTLTNLKDVQSDTLEIAKDLIALFNDENYTDWAIGSECNFQLLFEAFDALVAGVVVDFSIRVPYLSDRCAVPLY